MHWIDKFAKSTFQIFAGNTLEAFQPIDFFHFFPLWYDVYIDRMAQAIDILELEKKSYEEIKYLLPGPSSMLALLQKIIPTYKGYQVKNKEACKKVTNFLARMLEECRPADAFCESSNPVHTDAEVLSLMLATEWQNSTVDQAKTLGKLLTAAGSHVHGLYNDVVTDFSWDAFGPYPVQVGSKKYSVLIREFSNLAPSELWDNEFLSSVQHLRMYQLYEDVEWHMAGIGCHTQVTSGDPISGLRKWAVYADGKILSLEQVQQLVRELSFKAERLYQKIRQKDFEQLKKMVLLQECFQTKKLFEAAGLDWRPTVQMYERILSKPVMTGILPHGRLLTSLEEYMRDFGIDRFRKEVLG